MTPEFLQLIAVVTIGIFVLFGVVELFGWIDTGITYIIMSFYAKRIGWEFQPGVCSLFTSKPFKLISPDKSGLTVYVNRNVIMRYSYSNISVEMLVDNDTKGALFIRRKDFFEKERKYFKNHWDKKLLIQSKPVSFGKKIFSSDEMLSMLHKLIKGGFLSPHSHFKITPAGKLHLLLIDKGFTVRRTDALISLTKEAVSQLGQIRD